MSGAAQLGASLSSLGNAQNAQVEAMLKIKGKAKSASGEFEVDVPQLDVRADEHKGRRRRPVRRQRRA